MRFAGALLALILLPVAAMAVEAPLLYSRTTLLLHLQHPADKAKPTLAIDTEVREASSAAHTPGWFNFVSLGAFKAAMAVYAAPLTVTIHTTQDYAPLDVLMVDSYGTITQIMPKLVLAEMQEPIASAAPVLAVLYLRGGDSAALGIQPGDSVEYKLFKKKPVVITAPAGASPSEAASSAAAASETPPASAAPAAPVTPVSAAPAAPVVLQ